MGPNNACVPRGSLLGVYLHCTLYPLQAPESVLKSSAARTYEYRYSYYM